MLRFPGGFEDMEMAAIAKRHKMDQMVAFAQDAFVEAEFEKPWVVLDQLAKLVSRSSMVSMFEKPKFKGFIAALSDDEKVRFADALHNRLYEDEEQGFNDMLEMLSVAKLAKWSLISICPVYFSPFKEVYVKPTTTKGIIATLELKDLAYKPRPSWGFYKRYRDTIEEMKAHVCSSLSPNNAAFTGFLMMSLPSSSNIV